MSREVVALVSADDATAAVRVHADRVHDLLRRSGCGPHEAVEVAEATAGALLDALVTEPLAVGDMAGWWFGRALDLGERLGTAAVAAGGTDDGGSRSVLAGTSGEAQVRAALATLREPERAAVILRDAYDLPPQAVAVALGSDADAAAALVAAGRLRLVARYDSRDVPELPEAGEHGPADAAALAGLADGTLRPARAVPLRRHVSTCAACEDVLDMLAKGRRLAAGLPIVAMPDEAREAMLRRVGARAARSLPSVDEVLLAIEEDDDDRPLVSPLAIVFAIVLALILGVAVAAATRSAGAQPDAAQHAAAAAEVSPSFDAAPTPSRSPARVTGGSPAAAAGPPTASPPGSRSKAAAPSSVPASPGVLTRPAAVLVAPGSGPRGTRVSVTGTGWRPGAAVTVTYAGPVTATRTSVVADASGRFRVTVVADGLVPGDYAVTARGGASTATTTFRQES